MKVVQVCTPYTWWKQNATNSEHQISVAIHTPTLSFKTVDPWIEV